MWGDDVAAKLAEPGPLRHKEKARHLLFALRLHCLLRLEGMRERGRAAAVLQTAFGMTPLGVRGLQEAEEDVEWQDEL